MTISRALPRHHTPTLGALVLLGCLLGTPVVHAAPQSPAQVRSSIEFVDKLIRDSSVARHVRTHQFPAAMAYLQEAERLHAKAAAAQSQGSMEEAASRLQDATHMVLEAGRLSQLAHTQFDKLKLDYGDRLRSINALREAERRIVQEKGLSAETIDLERRVSNLLEEAQTLATEGKHTEGRTLLDRAYQLVKDHLQKIGGSQSLSEIEASLGQTPAGGTTHSLAIKQRQDYQNRLNSINSLREAQQRISKEKGEYGRQAELDRQIVPLLEQAYQLADKGKYDEGRLALDKGYLLVKASLEQLRGGETVSATAHAVAGDQPKLLPPRQDRQSQEFDNRHRTVTALLEAQQRIASDKGMKQEAQRVKQQANSLIGRSDALARSGKHHDGLALLNQAYTLVTESIEQLRGGETLVRSLQFANKEEEYRYELDRNNTYLMLVNLLIEDKSILTSNPMKAHLEEAAALRKLAEHHAQQGDFAAAVQGLEQATQTLIRALRGSGLMLPG